MELKPTSSPSSAKVMLKGSAVGTPGAATVVVAVLVGHFVQGEGRKMRLHRN